MTLKDIDYQILTELIKDSKTSDQSIAKLLNVSQPTVTRRRAKLEKEGSLEYTAIPNLKKLGFEILAFHFFQWKTEYIYQQPSSKEELKDARKRMKNITILTSENPSVIFGSIGQGLGMSKIIVTAHKTYSDFVEYKKELEESWGKYILRFESFIVSLSSDRILRNFTFKGLVNLIQEKKSLTSF